MTIEVFHWKLTKVGQESKAACDQYSQIIFGSTAAVQTALENAEALAAQGLLLEKVAQMEGDDKDQAFSLTNHIDDAWTKNPQVTVMGDGRWRSTSVGDLMRVDGEMHVVSSFGFTPVIAPEEMVFERPRQ